MGTLESLLCHRYAAYAAVLFMLLCLVAFGMPRPLALLSPGGGAYGGGARRYGCVIDAGSTGSRMHVFLFGAAADGQLELLHNDLEQLKPGLSSYADAPQKAAASLKPLLEMALKAVPAAQHAKTTIELRATAGLRLLPGDKAERILAAVRKLLGGYPFLWTDASVSIMDGVDEGAFQWVTHNYLSGRMGGPPGGTVATVDLGGGSVQLAYALEPAVAAKAPAGYVRPMRGGGASYNVYVHSYLGYGLMAARAATLAAGGTAAAGAAGHACLPRGHNGSFVYAGTTHPARGGADGADAQGCGEVVASIFRFDAPCTHAPCAFAGSWSGGGGAGARTFHVCSYLFDRAVQAGLVTPPDAAAVQTTPGAFDAAAKAACQLDEAALTAAYPSVEEADRPFFCADLVYGALLLARGFAIAPDAPITLVRRIAYHGREVEASWPLGAAINSMFAHS